jgi:hypothetical protein
MKADKWLRMIIFGDSNSCTITGNTALIKVKVYMPLGQKPKNLVVSDKNEMIVCFI